MHARVELASISLSLPPSLYPSLFLPLRERKWEKRARSKKCSSLAISMCFLASMTPLGQTNLKPMGLKPHCLIQKLFACAAGNGHYFSSSFPVCFPVILWTLKFCRDIIHSPIPPLHCISIYKQRTAIHLLAIGQVIETRCCAICEGMCSIWTDILHEMLSLFEDLVAVMAMTSSSQRVGSGGEGGGLVYRVNDPSMCNEGWGEVLRDLGSWGWGGWGVRNC